MNFDCCIGEQSDADIVELPQSLNVPLKFRFRIHLYLPAAHMRGEDGGSPVLMMEMSKTVLIMVSAFTVKR